MAAPAPETIDALVFTSGAAVSLVQSWPSPYRRKPVFAVGDATAAAARAAGFGDVRSAEGDGQALAALLLAACAPSERLLHPAAARPAFDLAAALAAAGRSLRTLAVYETVARDSLPPEAEAALAHSAVAAVLIHSPAAGRALAALLPSAAAKDLSLATLSPACVAPLQPLAFRAVAIAGAPTEPALLDALASLRLHAAADLGKRPPPR